MSQIEKALDELKASILTKLPGQAEGFDPTIARPPNAELGDLAIPAFPLAKALKRPPREIAEEWAAKLEPGTELAAGLRLGSAEAAGGFVNLHLETESLMRTVCSAVADEGPNYGALSIGAGSKVMVEYSSPNTNKPQHLGHVRNNAIGMSLSNLLEACGHEVIRAILVNDRGIHICKSMLAYRRWGEGETPQSSGEKGDHFVGRYYIKFNEALGEERKQFHSSEGIDPDTLDREGKERLEERFLSSSNLMAEAQQMLKLWEKEDPDTRALWQQMNDWVYSGFRETYDRLGCRFDRWYSESETWMLGRDEVERGLEAGIFYKSDDGSVWAKLEDEGLKDKLLLRTDGTSVYITQDIGTAKMKHDDYGMDRSLYVVGQEQVLHFKNLFTILRLLGHAWANGCHHVAYSLVTLPRGLGRLKSREGTAVDADDLLDLLASEARRRIEDGGYCGDDPGRVDATAEAIGQGALKVYLLQVGNDRNIVFDPEERLSFEGDTGPAVQYSHARICGIVRKGLEKGLISEADLVRAADVPDRDVYSAVKPERVDYSKLTSTEERDLALRLLDLPIQFATGWRQLSVAPVANYLLELTRAYARFYHAHRVLDAADEATRLARLHLSLCVAQVLRRGLSVLTVEAPDRM